MPCVSWATNRYWGSYCPGIWEQLITPVHYYLMQHQSSYIHQLVVYLVNGDRAGLRCACCGRVMPSHAHATIIMCYCMCHCMCCMLHACAAVCAAAAREIYASTFSVAGSLYPFTNCWYNNYCHFQYSCDNGEYPNQPYHRPTLLVENVQYPVLLLQVGQIKGGYQGGEVGIQCCFYIGNSGSQQSSVTDKSDHVLPKCPTNCTCVLPYHRFYVGGPLQAGLTLFYLLFYKIKY